MKTPKQALLDDGFPGVKQGKGRLSKAAIARVHELVAEGVQIKDYSVSSTPATADAPKTTTVTKGKTSGAKEVVELAPLRYNEGEWKAVSPTPIWGRTEFSMREVCSFCGVSLVGHVCEEPILFGKYRVDVVAR